MVERTSGIRSLLSVPAVYELMQRAFGSPRVGEEFIRGHVRPVEGDRVLDIGCGPGDILRHLPAVRYVGVDPSVDYIASARRRFGVRGVFRVAGVDDLEPADLGAFDVVIAKGVLHHLDDAQADRLFRVAAQVLAPSGRLVTIDPAYADGQSAASRFMVGQDRGRNVRRDTAYVALARRYFDQVEVTVHQRLLRIPYTHVILETAGARDVPTRFTAQPDGRSSPGSEQNGRP